MSRRLCETWDFFMSTIECRLFQASDTHAVAQLLASAFSASEPPAVAMGLTEAELEQFVRLLCPKAADEQLTIVAQAEDGEFAGVMLSDDFAAPPDLSPNSFSEKFLPIFAMLEKLDEQYRNNREILPGQYLHLFMLAVDERFAGRGIAQRMIFASLENARRKGFRYAVTEATGAVSQHVFGKLGFQERHRVLYQDYRFENRAVFSSIRGHAGTLLMDLAL